MANNDLPQVTTLTIRGQAIPVFLTTRVSDKSADALFTAAVKGKNISRTTLEELRLALMTETRRQAAKVSIPFSVVTRTAGYGGTPAKTIIRSGVITGQHASDTSKLLVRYDDGQPDQVSAYGSWMRRLSLEEQAELTELSARAAQATATLTQWTEAHALDARKAVEQAIAEQTAESAD